MQFEDMTMDELRRERDRSQNALIEEYRRLTALEIAMVKRANEAKKAEATQESRHKFLVDCERAGVAAKASGKSPINVMYGEILSEYCMADWEDIAAAISERDSLRAGVEEIKQRVFRLHQRMGMFVSPENLFEQLQYRWESARNELFALAQKLSLLLSRD